MLLFGAASILVFARPVLLVLLQIGLMAVLAARIARAIAPVPNRQTPVVGLFLLFSGATLLALVTFYVALLFSWGTHLLGFYFFPLMITQIIIGTWLMPRAVSMLTGTEWHADASFPRRILPHGWAIAIAVGLFASVFVSWSLGLSMAPVLLAIWAVLVLTFVVVHCPALLVAVATSRVSYAGKAQSAG